eukprot:m.150821 g.150821  ORF g.150821 m.150821 type:complete len:162 (-) comp16322_c0_seq4:1363-1848(-)
MPRSVAEGETQALRKILSHEHGRGVWADLAFHDGTQGGQWKGCGCSQDVKESWCARYPAGVGEDDKADWEAFKAKQEQYDREVQGRVQKGQPAAVAQGRTRAERQRLSHTLNKCVGAKECVKKGMQCHGEYVKQTDGNMKWSCCDCMRRDWWCPNYSGHRE